MMMVVMMRRRVMIRLVPKIKMMLILLARKIGLILQPVLQRPLGLEVGNMNGFWPLSPFFSGHTLFAACGFAMMAMLGS